MLFRSDLAAGDPQATLLTQVQGVIAEYEKAKIAERYRRGKLFRARAGEIITWKTSCGYRRVARAGGAAAHLEIYEPEAAVVRRIFVGRAAGITVREICRRLNADRIPSPTGKPTWGTSTLCRLPGNEACTGRVYFNRTETIADPRPVWRTRQAPPARGLDPDRLPRIITDEQFEAASRVACGNAKWSPRRAEPGEWLLKGLVRCGVCDVGTNCNKMRGRNGTWHRYYYCRNHDPLRADLPELHRRSSEVTARQRDLQTKRDSLAAERTALARGNLLRRRVTDFAQQIREVIDQLDSPQRQQLLRLLIEDVHVTGWQVKIRLRIPLDPPDPGPGPSRADSSRATTDHATGRVKPRPFAFRW